MTQKEGGVRVAVSIITGFLGSGKTTVIASLLRQPAMQGTAVIVNELGEVGIDDAIIAQSAEPANVLLLKNGCLCCTAGDDLTATLLSLAQLPKGRPRQILIETTGMADPVPLLLRLMSDPRLRDAIRLDAVVATVDGLNGLANLDDRPVAANQAGIADRRLITKTDLAEPHQIEALSRRLSELNPGADIRTISHGDVQASDLLGVSLYDPERRRARLSRWLNLDRYRARMSRHHLPGQHTSEVEPAHGGSVRSWLIEHDRALDWDKLSPRLGTIITDYGAALLRLKGVIWTTGDARPLVVHGVQRLFHHPVRIDHWPSEPRTSIVVIGDDGAGAATAVDLLAEALRATAAEDNPSLPNQANEYRTGENIVKNQ
jgi:G3E family GTPase